MDSALGTQTRAAKVAALQVEADSQAFIGIARVCEISGFSKSSILRKIAAGQFPAQVIKEGNVTRWDLGEVLSWRQARIRERDERQRAQVERSRKAA